MRAVARRSGGRETRPLAAFSSPVPPVLAAGALALALSGCGRDQNTFPDIDQARTAVEYDVFIEGAPSEDLEELIADSLLLERREDVGAQSIALLRRRAQDDVETVQRILRSFGYYESKVEMEVVQVEALAPPSTLERVQNAWGAITGAVVGVTSTVADVFREQPEEEPVEIEREDEPPGGFAEVTVRIDAGRAFELARHDLVLVDGGSDAPPTLPTAEQLGSPVGRPAAAEEIIVAENRAVQMLRQTGRPYATRLDRDSVADLDLATIEVDTIIGVGREYVFGEVRIDGAETVREDYLLTYQPFRIGERVDVRELEEFQQDLTDTGLFSSGSVRLPDEPPSGDSAPVLVELEERKPRTVSAGIKYSTDIGIAVNGGFEHRNLGNANEQINIDALVSLPEQRLEARFLKPQFRRDGQDFVAGFQVARVDDIAFEGTTATLRAGIEREIGDFWKIGYAGLGEASLIEDDGEGASNTAFLLGLPVYASYDDTNDLLDPRRGLRARIDLSPFVGTDDDGPLQFITTEFNGSTYYDLTGAEDYILAFRGRLGTILLADDVDRIPPPRRFYAGGGGSVRGYAERLIGPLDDDGDPIGGRSVIELATEIRAPIHGAIGGVVFLEGGSVTGDLLPTFSDGAQFAAGVGLRYASPVGPLRFDLAVPLNPREEDDAFQFYISIGQAF